MNPKLILYLALVLSGGLFGCSTVHQPLEKSKQSPTSSGNLPKTPNDSEIREKIIGTWIRGGVILTNDLGVFSKMEMLTFATNGCYSATKTIVSAGKTNVLKCQGLWSVEESLLTYSITNSIGVKPNSEPFFYEQAKVIKVSGKQLLLLLRMHQLVFFEKDFNADKP